MPISGDTLSRSPALLSGIRTFRSSSMRPNRLTFTPAAALSSLNEPDVNVMLGNTAVLLSAWKSWAWSRGVWDTDRPAAEILVKRATRFACSGMVLLLHDGRGDEERPDVEPMLAALPGILERLQAAGFQFATLDRA